MTQFQGATFVLAVSDLEKSRKFYIDKLGFKIGFEVGEGWAFLSRGSFKLRIGDCPDAKPISEYQDHSWFAYVHVTGIEKLYEEYKGNGVEIWHHLESKPWGMKEFAIVTIDKHRIVFCEEIK